jgi:bacillopeptidase F
MMRLARHPSRFHHAAWILAAMLLIPPIAATARAGTIDPDYERYLDTLPAGQQVSVIIMLADQVPLATLDATLRSERATLAIRHERVITELQAMAEATQGPVTAALEAAKPSGEVTGYTPYWIANLVVARMTVRAVREVASRPDVGAVYANFTASLVEPVGGTPAAGEAPEAPAFVGATPGLRAINAHRVWYELGITGNGRLICGLDTGVMGTHPALQARWRGAQVGIPWQWAWKDVLGGGTQFPSDSHGHGTHTMGTMVGLGVPTADTVGVAWRAQWIACNAINQGVSPEFDNDIIAAFQWIADPDGNPQTTGDVPDVVQNSWRINEGFPGGYTDCDPRWWAVMDGCEAAGCAVVFSAGNEGPGAETIGSPPDRITTPTNAYAIGAVSAQAGEVFPYTIAGFSSRGPSGCDHVTKKPSRAPTTAATGRRAGAGRRWPARTCRASSRSSARPTRTST